MHKIILSIALSLIIFKQGMANNDIISIPPEQSWTIEDAKNIAIEVPIGLNIDGNDSEIVLPIIDEKDELTGQQELKNEDKNRLRVGDHYKLPKIPVNKWRVISSLPEKYSIRIAIYAAKAKMIRVHFQNAIFTDQVKIFVYGEAKESFELLDRKKLNARNGYWSPPISGEYYYIECEYSNPPIIAPVIDKISVIDKDLSSGTDKVGPCHNDISCRSDLIRNYGSAVALIIYEDSIASHACTGALLNDLDPDTQIPWFLTANHCGIDSDVAPSAVFYFRYQTSTCDGVPPSYTTTPRILGAEHIISYAPSDVTLLRLEGEVPAGSWLLGFNSNPIAVGSQSYTIHHPDRSYKRISDGQIINYLPSSYDDTNHLTVLWTSGVTEGGSSGSPLFNDSGQVIGQLHGGPSSCYVSGNDRRDYYGRFSVSWNNGLSTYLSSRYSPPVAASIANSGIWVYGPTGSSWAQITPSTPENIIYSGTTLYAEFGAGGIWRWNGTSWTQLTPSNPENMVASGSTLYAEFGAGGIWSWNGSSWTMLTPSNPENMVVSGSTLYAEFGAGGIWRWNGTSWTQLTPSNPENMVASGSTLYVEFGAGGIWSWNGSSWTMLTPSNPENMVVSGSTLYAEFGTGGIWIYNGSSWARISDANPESMVASGSTLYADFGAGGIYMWNGSSWRGISGANPENMMMSGSMLYADFGAGGLYLWNGTTWSWLLQANPIVMAAASQ